MQNSSGSGTLSKFKFIFLLSRTAFRCSAGWTQTLLEWPFLAFSIPITKEPHLILGDFYHVSLSFCWRKCIKPQWVKETWFTSSNSFYIFNSLSKIIVFAFSYYKWEWTQRIPTDLHVSWHKLWVFIILTPPESSNYHSSLGASGNKPILHGPSPFLWKSLKRKS